MITVINMVNFIPARELNHRKFKSLLEELGSEYGDVLLHTGVRWLIRTKVSERFTARINFVSTTKTKVYSELKKDSWWCLLAFLCHIT